MDAPNYFQTLWKGLLWSLDNRPQDARRFPRYTQRTLNHIFERTFATVAKQRAVSNDRQNSFKQVEFVELRMGEADKELYTAWEREFAGEFPELWGKHVHDGHKYGITWDEYNDTFIASVTCRDDRSPNNGKCVTARHSNPTTALMLVYFKAAVWHGDAPWASGANRADWG